MINQLIQWNFVIKGLIPDQVKLKRKIWLKRDELLLDKKGNDLHAYLLGNDTDGFHIDKRITPYLRISCLISNNAPNLEGGGGTGISSKEELGTKPMLSASLSVSLPEEAIADIENYAHKFIRFIGKLHDKYIDVVSENEFMEIALDYFYEAQKKFVYNNEGFISTMISMEALFNEGPTDIKYKLAHRAAFLFGLCNIDPIEAFEKLKDFYDNRSTLVHGGGTIPDDPDRYLVSKYTQRSIIIFLILLKNEERRKVGRKKRKGEILKEIDYAMLNEEKRKSLKKEIDKGLKDFKLPIPRSFEGVGKNGNYRVTAW
ncbi:MAG: hypothetical protein AAGU75_11130 [Bacillota bacterium]